LDAGAIGIFCWGYEGFFGGSDVVRRLPFDFCVGLLLFRGVEILAGDLVFEPEGLAAEVGKLQVWTNCWVIWVFSMYVG
jgi:hypothetical protein